jgi:hypothetical protein
MGFSNSFLVLKAAVCFAQMLPCCCLVKTPKQGGVVQCFKGNTKQGEKVYDPTPQEVYNLEVGQWHNFLVGKSSVVAHNTGCKITWGKVRYGPNQEFALLGVLLETMRCVRLALVQSTFFIAETK